MSPSKMLPVVAALAVNLCSTAPLDLTRAAGFTPGESAPAVTSTRVNARRSREAPAARRRRELPPRSFRLAKLCGIALEPTGGPDVDGAAKGPMIAEVLAIRK